ncbi:hypothetical protein PhaeoP18_03036 [Phaeobacter piscinae]|mgnify:CR=1 FL=1|uniref:Uncharacterized protein n=1 Tax=Phaeobacter piscinae TaxID=1580596 RepID=A0AAN1GTY9_9RHOB|nr:hypothetical protein PhaeoP13_03057 [Phaeobacter piscinae]AUQ75901.1 hypothetical protein PhaeoP71_03070 [Phaeobacter piscinae]AUR37263.1 hypothetical protein PhaeoP18_03036 [Phaeobacter piscinae]
MNTYAFGRPQIERGADDRAGEGVYKMSRRGVQELLTAEISGLCCFLYLSGRSLHV